jgi:hypothetical protein
VAEEIKTRPAKHLALQHFEAVDTCAKGDTERLDALHDRLHEAHI